jgi:U4/U6 small nuclear ribonucleoprotein PRP4
MPGVKRPRDDEEDLKEAVARGNINIAGGTHASFEMSEATLERKREHEERLRQVQAQHAARTISVPTSDPKVKLNLRVIGEPIVLFGEKAPERRERLRTLLMQIVVQQGVEALPDLPALGIRADKVLASQVFRVLEERTEGSEELYEARVFIAEDCVGRAAERKAKRSEWFLPAEPSKEHIDAFEQRYAEVVDNLKDITSVSSQIGDVRAISAIAFDAGGNRLASASWNGGAKVWDVASRSTRCYYLGHAPERVTDVQFHPLSGTQGYEDSWVNLATCGEDALVKLWSLPREPVTQSNQFVQIETPLAVLKGHTARCARMVFHPSGDFLATTSFDCSWRLWDVDRETCVLTQPGHLKPTYGVAMHPDGSILCVTDLSAISMVWDLRTGETAASLVGHARQVLACSFSPNGHHVATSGSDNTVKVWDLRTSKCLYTMLAHHKTVSDVKFEQTRGEFLVSASHDSTLKVWSAYDFSLIQTLAGHEDLVMRCDIAREGGHIASACMDHTLRLWK